MPGQKGQKGQNSKKPYFSRLPAISKNGTKFGQNWDKIKKASILLPAHPLSDILLLQPFPVPAHPVPVLLRPDLLPAISAVFGGAGILCNEFLTTSYACIHCPVACAAIRPFHALPIPSHEGNAPLSLFYSVMIQYILQKSQHVC